MAGVFTDAPAGCLHPGCGAALVGSSDPVMSKLDRCQQMGIRAFVRSGDLHHNECDQSGAKVLPWLKTCPRNPVHGRLPAGEPLKPMGNGPRR